MNDKEIRLGKVLRGYMGTYNVSSRQLHQEIGIARATLAAIVEGKSRLIESNTMALILYWLLTPTGREIPTTAIEDTEPAKTEVALPVVRKPVGKQVTLSPRMQQLVNRQEQRSE